MTVRASQIVVADDSTDSWAYDTVRHNSHAIDVLALRGPSVVSYWVLPMVRGIMRERSTSLIPRVVGLIRHPENKYGHDLQIEVEYDRHGWRAIYAANTETPSDVSCYMD